MGLERNYRVRIPSKQINKRFYTSQRILPETILLNPWFITGFTDAEGCFGLYIYKNDKIKTGWSISLVYQISLHKKDKQILEQIQNYFGVGGITSHGSTSLKYSVRSIKDMQIIIDHFNKFPLITNKLNDYILFKLAYAILLKKEQLSLEPLLLSLILIFILLKK